MYPESFQNLINSFKNLPSIGPKQAERLVLFLFKQKPEILEEFARHLEHIQNLRKCMDCFNISQEERCTICINPKRTKKIICVVEEPLDIIPIERTRLFTGVYHVLGGSLYLDNKEHHQLNIQELLIRITKEKPEEIIIATNFTTEGDATALYLKRKLLDTQIKITRLGRGLSTGSDIEYSDEMTLIAALTNRQVL